MRFDGDETPGELTLLGDETPGELTLLDDPGPIDPVYDQLNRIEEKLDTILARTKDIQSRLDSTESLIRDFLEGLKPYLDQVAPVVDALQNSPLFRMIAPSSKKGK